MKKMIILHFNLLLVAKSWKRSVDIKTFWRLYHSFQTYMYVKIVHRVNWYFFSCGIGSKIVIWGNFWKKKVVKVCKNYFWPSFEKDYWIRLLVMMTLQINMIQVIIIKLWVFLLLTILRSTTFVQTMFLIDIIIFRC